MHFAEIRTPYISARPSRPRRMDFILARALSTRSRLPNGQINNSEAVRFGPGRCPRIAIGATLGLAFGLMLGAEQR
jgi:hypothetical protein